MRAKLQKFKTHQKPNFLLLDFWGLCSNGTEIGSRAKATEMIEKVREHVEKFRRQLILLNIKGTS